MINRQTLCKFVYLYIVPVECQANIITSGNFLKSNYHLGFALDFYSCIIHFSMLADCSVGMLVRDVRACDDYQLYVTTVYPKRVQNRSIVNEV